jgi:hypothetical protein
LWISQPNSWSQTQLTRPARASFCSTRWAKCCLMMEADGYRAIRTQEHHLWWVHAFRKHRVVPRRFGQIDAAAAALLPGAAILLYVPVLSGNVMDVPVGFEAMPVTTVMLVALRVLFAGHQRLVRCNYSCLEPVHSRPSCGFQPLLDFDLEDWLSGTTSRRAASRSMFSEAPLACGLVQSRAM